MASQSRVSCGVNWKCHFSVPVSGFEREQRTRIQVVSRAHVAVVVGPGIARAPVQQIQRRIVGAGQPRRCAAVLPGVAAAPRVRSGLARRRHGPEAPRALAGLRVVGVEEAANAALRAGDADDDLVLDRERRAGRRVVERRVGDLLLPQHATRSGVERDQLRVQRRQEQRRSENRQAAIDLAAADVDPRRNADARTSRAPGPVSASSAITSLGGRVTYITPSTTIGVVSTLGVHLMNPLGPQPVDVVGVDLVQRAVVMAPVVAAVRQPVARLVGRLEQPLVGDRQPGRRRLRHARRDGNRDGDNRREGKKALVH